MTMGLLDALAMGFGMKDRTPEYYELTEQSIRKDPLGTYRRGGLDPDDIADRYAAIAESEGYPVRGGPFRLARAQTQKDIIDAFDGGGFGYGQSGDTFQGGPSSMFLNLIGIRPMGFNQRNPQGVGMPLRAPMATFDILPDILK